MGKISIGPICLFDSDKLLLTKKDILSHKEPPMNLKGK